MPRSSAAIAKELRAIRTSFRRLARSFGKIGPILMAVPDSRTLASGEKPVRKRPQFSRAFRAELKLQGKYMGTMRGLSARKVAQVKRIRVEKGIRAAIAAAGRMAV